MAQPKKKKRRRRRHGDPERAQIAARREEAKRRAREERRRAAIAEEKRKQRRKKMRRGATWAIAGLSVAVIALIVFRSSTELEGVITPEEIEARPLTAGETFDYGTPTPTSGPYTEGEPQCGVFPEQIEPEAAVTALYYGAVVIWHDPDLPLTETAALSTMADETDTHVVVSPNPDLDVPMVATAWNRRLDYEVAADVAEFIDTYRKKGPDSADCPV